MTSQPAPARATTAELFRSWRGVALLGRGFRPFFLGAGAFAATAMAIWPAYFSGLIDVPTAFSPVDWHAHEFVLGYGSAVVAGFLLTAIPNWTGRLPVVGGRLAALAGLWLAGRVAISASAEIGRAAAGVVDCAFLFALAAVAGREVLAGNNKRNLKVVGLVVALGLANVAFHGEAWRNGVALYSARAALAILVMLILVIGGRVAPSFTSTWLAKSGVKARPAPFGRFDVAALAVSAAALVGWVAAPESAVVGALALVAGGLDIARVARWQGVRVWRDPLLFVLHVGALFAALGFVAAGTHALAPVAFPYAAAVHVWAIGAVGMMTMAMMTRATLGHSGRPLVASKVTIAAYCSIVAAVLARLAMALWPAAAAPAMHVAACFWVAGFALFLYAYAPLLTRRARP
ncbi:MAG: NnrS family protein [Pseudomonadota bacterium]|nr:NnrS family protein [Pseudomonadota bacterium]